MQPIHPRDRFITVYGRKPVLEALHDKSLRCDKLLCARNATGAIIDEIKAAAKERGIKVKFVEESAVTRISKNGRQDQGVVMDIEAEMQADLETWLQNCPEKARIFALDGITTPANVGMILRSLTAAGVDGIVLPREGSPEIDALVIKASAGVAFRAPILRTPSARDAAYLLATAGFTLYGLRAYDASDLYHTEFADKSVFFLGSETFGLSQEVEAYLTKFVSIPLARGVESLNVASAAAVVGFELARQTLMKA